MPGASSQFSQHDFIKEFEGALSILDSAENVGCSLGKAGTQRLFFVGCGAPLFMMKAVAYWAEKFTIHTEVRVYSAAEFVHQDPAALDEGTAVFLGSHSGTTKEVVQAAEFLLIKPCKTIAFTQHADSALGKTVGEIFSYGSSRQGYFSSFILTLAFMSAYLKERELGWNYHKKIMDSLANLPEALAEAKERSQKTGRNLAEEICNADILYIIGSGPMYTTSYVFASCFLMEMQWMHAFPLSAAEFFHGPFEVFDMNTPAILLLGEDPSRPEAERVLKFCRKNTIKPMVFDSRDYSMPGIHPEIRPLVAPFILDAALTNLVETLAVIRQHPLSTRRYMGKVEY